MAERGHGAEQQPGRPQRESQLRKCRNQPDRRMQVNRRLYRCRENRVLAGVASGVAEFFGLDPTLVRVLWFLSIFVGGVSLLLYIGLAIIVPLEPVAAGTVTTPADPLESHRHG